MTLTWPGFDGWEFKYVNNKKAPVGEYSLEDYDKYIESVHLDYIAQTSKDGGSWFNWDHWLDQHIGLKYQETGEECRSMDREVRASIFSDSIPVGERRDFAKLTTGIENHTTHYYTGYKGSIAWEMNVQCSTDDGAPDVCACLGANNDELFLQREGYSCASDQALEGTIISDDDKSDDAAPGPSVTTNTSGAVTIPDTPTS